MDDQTGPYNTLPRGGILIPTSSGNIQFGIPSETIKDTMRLKGGVPGTYIVPNYMFDLNRGIALADVEFPVYFNFFIKKGKTRIICNENQRKRIESVISEALFGPEALDVVDEFAEGESTPGFPDLKAEMGIFRKMPMAANGVLELDDLIEFHVFDDRGRAVLDDIEVQFDTHYNLRVAENGRDIAIIGRNVPIMANKRDIKGSRLDFHPPLFGITTLGAGHGFDPNADTSGLIIWVNRRGIVVDPPVNSTENLLLLGVSPKLVDNVILTHCHADHDAGTLQKILQEGRVNIYTTNTIYRSFMKKSSALTGIDESQLTKLVNFFPVCIGKPMIIGGGKFHFNYTLHSIPTISIQASLYGKSMIYSSDTMNDPGYINQLFEDGILTEDRRDFLLNFPWNQDVVFHEAGIPPIHTPLSYLCSLPEEIRRRVYLVHVNPDTIPRESGLRIAPTGLVNTIELDVNPLPYDEAFEMLDAFSQIDLFEHLQFEKAREFLLVSTVSRYREGEIIFRKGDRSDRFYVVINGEIDIILGGRIITTYDVGGYFGEKGIFLDENRTATAVAKTDCRVLSIQKDEMLSLIRGTESEYLLRQIATFQNVELRDTLNKSPLLENLMATQQTQLHGLVMPFPDSFQAGEIIANRNTAQEFTYIVREGSVDVYRDNEIVKTLTEGGLFGVRSMFDRNNINDLQFKARDNVRLYCIERNALERYIDNNPRVYIRMYHYPY